MLRSAVSRMNLRRIIDMRVEWELLHPKMTMEHLGFLPLWLDDDDPRGAAEQLDHHYMFGGFKQHPIKGFKALKDMHLKYPGDPMLVPRAKAKLRDETVCFYDSAFVAVWQKDGSFVVARFD